MKTELNPPKKVCVNCRWCLQYANNPHYYCIAPKLPVEYSQVTGKYITITDYPIKCEDSRFKSWACDNGKRFEEK